jgi:hypothetical protein
MRCAQLVRLCCRARADAPEERRKATAAVYVAALVVLLLLFGLYDMQLSSIRDMLFVGLWIGVMCAFPVGSDLSYSILPAYWRHHPVRSLPQNTRLLEGSTR